jgi:hypothetical protein
MPLSACCSPALQGAADVLHASSLLLCRYLPHVRVSRCSNSTPWCRAGCCGAGRPWARRACSHRGLPEQAGGHRHRERRGAGRGSILRCNWRQMVVLPCIAPACLPACTLTLASQGVSGSYGLRRVVPDVAYSLGAPCCALCAHSLPAASACRGALIGVPCADTSAALNLVMGGNDAMLTAVGTSQTGLHERRCLSLRMRSQTFCHCSPQSLHPPYGRSSCHALGGTAASLTKCDRTSHICAGTPVAAGAGPAAG